MNNTRRKELAKIHDALTELRDRLDEIQADEQDYLDNIPENLQGSERYEQSEAAQMSLEDAMDALDTAVESIEAAME